MSETYILNGPIDFYFPHPVRYPAQLVVEIRPGGILPSSQYQVIGYGPTATGVTVRYPSAPTDAAHELVISRHTEPERVSEFEDDVGATAAALNAEFDNLYQVLQDLDWAAGRYFGPLSEDPTEAPNGNALEAGDFYFNTIETTWRVFDGSAWKTASALADASSAPLPGYLILRDAEGRAQVAEPSAAEDIATKGYVNNYVIDCGVW